MSTGQKLAMCAIAPGGGYVRYIQVWRDDQRPTMSGER